MTCGGLCPGINTVIREVVCGLNYMYGVSDILGIEVTPIIILICYPSISVAVAVQEL